MKEYPLAKTQFIAAHRISIPTTNLHRIFFSGQAENMFTIVKFCEIHVLFIFLAKIASIPVGKKLENLG